MNIYTLTFNSSINYNGFVITAHDMADAISQLKDLIKEGWELDGILTQNQDHYKIKA